MNSKHKSSRLRQIPAYWADFTPKSFLSHCLNTYYSSLHSFSLLFLFLFSVLSLAPTTAQFAVASEIDLGKALEKNITIGNPIWLNDGETKFFSVFNADQSGQPKGGAIILHDADSHPARPEVIQPLHGNLPKHGWATISIQLPPLKQLSEYNNNQALIRRRIESAVNHLRTSGYNNIVLIGHGTGAMAATNYLAAGSTEFIRALVAISLGVLNTKEKKDSIPAKLENVKLPILDVYGSNDLSYITSSAKRRALASKLSGDAATRANTIEPYRRSVMAVGSGQKAQGYIAYRQIKVEGADHDFSGTENILTKRIIGWLERHAKGVAVSSPR